MRGTKRFAASDPSPDSNETTSQSKRIMEGSPFGFHRAQPFQPLVATTQPFDMKRAESSQQHDEEKSSLYIDFDRSKRPPWIQTQLKNHPDELWEDGGRDYLTHASSIMEKFSDVVNWIKSNAAKGGSSPPATNSLAATKSFAEVASKENNIFGQKTVFPPVSTATNSTFSWNPPAMFSNNKTHVLFGNQSSALSKDDASDDVDEEDELKQPSSPSVKKSEEKGVVVVHEVKCKLYRKSTDPEDKDVWKDKGMGQLSIKCKEGFSKATKESKPTIVVRNEVGKILLNALLYPGIKTNQQKNSLVAIFHTSDNADGSGGDNVSVIARTFLIRMKTGEDRNKLASVIQEYAPES